MVLLLSGLSKQRDFRGRVFNTMRDSLFAPADEVEKLELKTEVEGDLKAQSKKKPGGLTLVTLFSPEPLTLRLLSVLSSPLPGSCLHRNHLGTCCLEYSHPHSWKCRRVSGPIAPHAAGMKRKVVSSRK